MSVVFKYIVWVLLATFWVVQPVVAQKKNPRLKTVRVGKKGANGTKEKTKVKKRSKKRLNALYGRDFINRSKTFKDTKRKNKKVIRKNEEEMKNGPEDAKQSETNKNLGTQLTPREKRELKKKQKKLKTRSFDIQDKETQKRLKRNKKKAKNWRKQMQ